MPPFIHIPAHVDGQALYGAAKRLDTKLKEALPAIAKELSGLHPDYSESEFPEPKEPGYYAEWFQRNANNFLSYLQVYANIIAMAIPKSRPNLSSVRLLDYGGGWGLMGMLAKEAGIGHVTYLDYDPGVVASVKVINRILDMSIDEAIYGNEETLRNREESKFDSVVSSDVLEHVYDLDNVFSAISECCAPGAYVFHQTGANPRSPYQRIKLMKLHRTFETEDPVALEKLHAQGGLAIWEERKQFIQSYDPAITGPRLEKLARSCRGLNGPDLLKAINKFKENGTFPVPEHPTNTCRLSGYWIERLMDPTKVADQMAAHGFRTRITSTFLGPGKSNKQRRLIKHAINFTSMMSKTLGMKVSFYYGVHGIKL